MLSMTNEDVGPADSSVIVRIKTLYDCWIYEDQTGKGLGDRRLCVIHAALILARAPKSRTCVNLAVVLYDQKTRPVMDIPDYALDRHTQRGYEKGRKWEHFITDASVLIQPDPAKIVASDKGYQEKAEAILRAGWKTFPEGVHNPYVPDEKRLMDPDEPEYEE